MTGVGSSAENLLHFVLECLRVFGFESFRECQGAAHGDALYVLEVKADDAS